MSLAVSPAFPTISAIPLVVGTAYSELSSFIIQRPIFGAVWQKAHSVTTMQPRDVVTSEEGKKAACSLTTSLLSSAVQSYAASALLRLTNVNSYKGATILGTILLAAQSGQELLQSIIDKQPIDVLVSSLIVKLLDTVGLTLVLQAYHQNYGRNIVSTTAQQWK